jgi:chitinase
MFIFKFVTPYIYSIYKIHANHEITLFILCKKAYHQMKAFYHFVKTKSNFLKLAPYFTEFTKSQKYSALIETLSSDIDTIMAQMTVYQLDIASCSKDIKN